MGRPEQIIAKWYEYNCRELKGSVGWQNPQPITWNRKKEEEKQPLSLIVLNRSECLVLVGGWGNWEILSVAVSDRQRRFVFCTQRLMTQPDICEHWLMTDASNCKQMLRMLFPFILDNHFVFFHLSLSCGSSCVLLYFISISKSLEEKAPNTLKNSSLCTKVAACKIHIALIVLAPSEYDFTFNITK